MQKVEMYTDFTVKVVLDEDPLSEEDKEYIEDSCPAVQKMVTVIGKIEQEFGLESPDIFSEGDLELRYEQLVQFLEEHNRRLVVDLIYTHSDDSPDPQDENSKYHKVAA